MVYFSLFHKASIQLIDIMDDFISVKMLHLKLQPKLFISMIYPLLALIMISLIYVGYSDYKYIKQSTYQQAENNLDIANEYLNQHLNAVDNQLYLLGETYKYNYNVTEFLLSAQYLLNNETRYLEIGLLTSKNEYYATNYVYNGDADDNRSRVWFSDNMDYDQPFISTLYQSEQTNKWTVAIVRLLKLNNGESARIVLELDILGLYDKLSLLKTLMHGYVYAVDTKTGEIVMHPDPSRISTKSVSVTSDVLDSIASNTMSKNTINYTYQGQNKFSIYESKNQFGWVLLSNSNNTDLTYKALNIGVVSFALFAILVVILMTFFISNRIHSKGQVLSGSTRLEDIYSLLLQMASELIKFDKMFLFIHNPYNQQFEEPIHNIRLSESDVFSEVDDNKINALKIDNPLIPDISSVQRCVRIPLYNKGLLVGVLYLTNSNLNALHFMNIFRNYAQSALINMLLTQKIRSEDSMTHLMNKAYLRQQMGNQIKSKTADTYLAMIDLDDFKIINDTYGHLFGDLVIIKTADMLKHYFNHQTVTSRYGGEEFAVLFQANDEQQAYKKLDEFRYGIETMIVSSEDKQCQLTVSIGFAKLRTSIDMTIYDADKALYLAKNNSKNKVYQSIEIVS
ncbi:sensor domain-containing diguanylate cyclase [Moritella dasanensis]|uniref:sensor domain-containing diguanylate cyclase n=1 Tax=Moritella dasanensis TaxID=428031 RepID=UPI0002D42A7E|nr:sensor domain-containing diguanylate cyclase [Moritella dasanensis]